MYKAWNETHRCERPVSSEAVRQQTRAQCEAFVLRRPALRPHELASQGVQYCLLLSGGDLSYCEELALWLFVQIRLVSAVLSQTGPMGQQRAQLDTFTNSCLENSPWRVAMGIAEEEIQTQKRPRARTLELGGAPTPEPSLPLNLSLLSSVPPISAPQLDPPIPPSDFYPTEPESPTPPSPSAREEVLELSVDDLLALPLAKVQFLNVQERHLSLPNVHIANFPHGTIDSAEFNPSCSTLVFFTRSPKITAAEVEIYRTLSSDPHLPPAYWLAGGYQQFKKFWEKIAAQQPRLPYVAPPIPTATHASSPPQPPLSMALLRSTTTQPPSFLTTPPPLVALPNYGSTCYINSMVQCLFRVDKFRNLILALGGSHNGISGLLNGLFTSFYSLSLQSTTPPLVNITPLLKAIAAKNPALNIPNEQQDTSQVLYLLLDALHEELKGDTPPAFGDRQLQKWFAETIAHEGFSNVQNLFQTVTEIEMRCTRCGHMSVRYEMSNVLHLSLEGAGLVTLDQVIQNNLKGEEMSERLGNAWDCDGCRKAQKSIKRLSELNSTPEPDDTPLPKKNKFKMFKSRDSRARTASPSRNSTPDLRYMTENEMSEYEHLRSVVSKPKVATRSLRFAKLPSVLAICLTIFDPSRADAKASTGNLAFPLRLTLSSSQGPRSYTLQSRIDHLGTSIASGHYTAIVRSAQAQSWVECDDERLATLGPLGSEPIRDSNVYLLFYETA